MEVRDRARRIGGEVDERVREAEGMRRGIGRRSGMNEDHRAPPLQLLEDGVELLVAEVDTPRIREEHDAVELQGVERVRELRERTIDVRQRQAREPAEALWTCLHKLRGELVAASSERARASVIAHVHSWRA